ncbi:Extradiol ring-cleavage dioxygenase, class III enzyme, subunit B [Entophlyctis helioformis]|nr:Extradiol ring-cleavage dioxygenase, class III enzyme, subunit B [Entophlyctis helioformis]
MTTGPAWKTALLRASTAGRTRMPVVSLAHGSPMLIMPESAGKSKFDDVNSIGGPNGRLATFLTEFGPFLLDEYKPKALVVFSAHWETSNGVEIMSYDKNHLLYDYYGFPKELYNLDFQSNGSPAIASRIASLLAAAHIPARTITKGRGLDHGVFVPFLKMLPNPVPIPIVEVSMHTLDPHALLALGAALSPLRDEGILIISGGLSIHTFDEFDAWDPAKAPQGFKDFEQAVKDSVLAPTVAERNDRLVATTTHPFFRRAHPREEHFVPVYVAAGAGSDDGDKAVVVSGLHGAITMMFGV